jgi:hypothetical protein
VPAVRNQIGRLITLNPMIPSRIGLTRRASDIAADLEIEPIVSLVEETLSPPNQVPGTA